MLFSGFKGDTQNDIDAIQTDKATDRLYSFCARKHTESNVRV